MKYGIVSYCWFAIFTILKYGIFRGYYLEISTHQITDQSPFFQAFFSLNFYCDHKQYSLYSDFGMFCSLTKERIESFPMKICLLYAFYMLGNPPIFFSPGSSLSGGTSYWLSFAELMYVCKVRCLL